MARILLGVSSGIAAYKALELVRLAVKAGHAVRVVQTEASTRFVGPASFAALAGAPVLTSEFERDPAQGRFPDQPAPNHDPLSHLELVRNADAYLIAPASANTLAKLAHGLADNLLCSAALAATCPVLVAPAMNNAMYEHPATRANLDTLRARGITVLEPEVGALGSRGEWGVGRLREPAELLAALQAVVPAGAPRSMDGLRVLVTAGGTREPIDSVRYVGNRSSGRMGAALADEAARRGATVTVVGANISLPRNPVVSYIDVGTAAQLEGACADAFGACDVLLMTAAVADYRPAAALDGKLDKTRTASLEITLERTADVVAGLARRRRPGQTLVGFAAVHGDDVAAGRGKLERKGLDLVVVNDIARADIGFDAIDNEVKILAADGSERRIPRASKAEVAAAVIDEVERHRGAVIARPVREPGAARRRPAGH
ncbi:MAG: bifunctional phosphopantothenoylcysteine decarboxylase/phosphopantothenate--cysteine ligase CoaBC [Actinomycetota bacterium]|nr:bifunctional phosphopantothenoylcysteine decarboxylase/phosphopantothenate--cysteine ligase CoaBC [Actinomycetota bacterium]